MSENHENITEEDLKKARHFWSAVCEEVDADFSYEEAQKLQAKGLLENLVKLPGRGRYAGRWQAYPSNLLIELVTRKNEKIRSTSFR